MNNLDVQTVMHRASKECRIALLRGLSRQSTILVLALLCLVLIACAVGIGIAVLFETMPHKWAIYTCLSVLLVGLILGTGNARHSLFFIAAVGVPLNVGFRFFSREGTGSAGLYMSAPDACALLLLTLLLLPVLTGQRKQFRWCPRTTIPWLLLLGAATWSMPLSYEKTLTMYRAILLIQNIILYLALANALSSETDVLWMLKYLTVALVAGSVLYMVSVFTGLDFDLVNGEGKSLATIEEYGDVVRASGTFGHPIQAGQYFVTAIWIPLALLRVSRNVLAPIFLYAVFALGSVCIAYTLSRAAYISYGCAIAFYLYYGVRRGFIKKSTAVASCIVVCVLCVPVGGMVWARLTLDDKGTGASRTPLNKQATYIAMKNPVLGVGMGAYVTAMANYRPPGLKIGWEAYVHNEYLKWWAECGTPGLLVLLLFLASAAIEARRTLKSRSPVLRAVGFAFLCMLAALIPNMWYDVGFVGLGLPASQLFTVVLGVIAAARSIEQEQQSMKGSSLVGI